MIKEDDDSNEEYCGGAGWEGLIWCRANDGWKRGTYSADVVLHANDCLGPNSTCLLWPGVNQPTLLLTPISSVA